MPAPDSSRKWLRLSGRLPASSAPRPRLRARSNSPPNNSQRPSSRSMSPSPAPPRPRKRPKRVRARRCRRPSSSAASHVRYCASCSRRRIWTATSALCKPTMVRDPYRYFRVEARELLDQLAKGALELEKGAAAPALISLMLRLAHTLKGAARVVKQREIADHAHAIEDALAMFREGDAAVSRDGINATLKALDEISLRMVALAPQPQSKSTTQDDSDSIGRGLASILDGPIEAVTTNVDEMDTLLENLSEASVQVSTLRSELAPLQRSRRLAQLLEEQWLAELSDRSSG